MKHMFLLLAVLSLLACESSSVWLEGSSSSTSGTTTTSSSTSAASTNANLASFVQLDSVSFGKIYAVRVKLNQNGTLALYINNDDAELKIANTDGSGVLTLSSTDGGSVVDSYDLSGDGSTVIFTGRGSHDGTYQSTSQVYSLNSDGTGIKNITPAGGVGLAFGALSLTADGNKIAFLSYDDFLGLNSDYSSEIYTMSADGSGLTQLTDFPASTSITDMVMSKDGSTFVFQTRADLTGGNIDGNRQLFMMDSTGSSYTQITANPDPLDYVADTHSMDISDDGSMLVFASYADLIGTNSGGFEVGYQIDLNLMETRQFSNLGYGGIAISGDGNWIFVASRPEGSWEWDITKVSSAISSSTSYSVLPVLNDSSDYGLYIYDVEADYDGTSFALVSDYDFIDGENQYLGDRLFFGATN